MNFEVDFLVRASWVEGRLNHTEIRDAIYGEIWEVPSDLASQLWMPWLFFGNCKGCSEILFDPSTQKTFLNIRNAMVYLIVNFREIRKFTCSFDLTYYPFDYQSCYVKIETLAAPFNALVNINPFLLTSEEISNIQVPPEFILLDFTVVNCQTNHESGILNKTMFAKMKGKNACLAYGFHMKRRPQQHLVMTYVPSVLIVMISWISFGIDVEKTPARVALGLTSMLTLVTQLTSIQKNLPWGGYLKAIDIWMFTCILMVFASLVEYHFANKCHSRNKIKMLNADSTPAKLKFSKTKCCKSRLSRVSAFLPRKCRCRNTFTSVNAYTVDRIASILFPSTFVLFCIIYWGGYVLRLHQNERITYENKYEI